MKTACSLRQRRFRTNLKLAKQLWPDNISALQLQTLEHLTSRYGFLVAAGDCQRRCKNPQSAG